MARVQSSHYWSFGFVILSLVCVSVGTNLPPGGCDACRQLRGLEGADVNARNAHEHALIGNFKGLFNTQGGKFKRQHAKGSGPVNLEVFQEVGNHVAVVEGEAGDTLEKCCDACSRTAGCYQYHFFRSIRLRDNVNVRGFMSGVQCYLLGKDGGSGHAGEHRIPVSGDVQEQQAMSGYFPLSWLGGLCDGGQNQEKPAAAGTQHSGEVLNSGDGSLPVAAPSSPSHADEGVLVQAKKKPVRLTAVKRRMQRPPPLTPQGLLNGSFCLVADRRLHINIVLRESPPSDTLSADLEETHADWAPAGAPSSNPTLARISTAAVADAAAAARKDAAKRATAAVVSAAVATAGGGEVTGLGDGGEEKEEGAQAAVREVGIVWVAEGRHSLHMAVAPRVVAESGPVDAHDSLLSHLQVDGLPLLVPKEVGDKVTAAGGLVLSKVAEEREWPVYMVKYRVEIEGLMEVEVRASIVQGEGDEGEGHLVVKLIRIKATPNVKGILGQAIRASTKLALPIATAITLDGHSLQEKRALSGPLSDYVSSTPVSPDCRFATFGAVV